MTLTVPSCDVAIVGAGIAGLVAADVLSQTGRTVKCFEARERVGGRALSVERSGLAIDLGATWFWSNEPLIRSLMDDHGVGSFPQSLFGDAMFEAFDQAPQRIDGNPIDGPSYRFTQGAQSLPLALAQRVASGVLNLSDPVHAIRQGQESVLVDATSGSLSVQHVILALPPALAVDAITFTPELPEPLRDTASETAVWMGDMIKAVAVYDEPFWRADELAGAAISYRGPFREFHDHSGPENGAGAIFGFAPATAIPDAGDSEIAAIFSAQLSRIFGNQAARPRHILVKNWASETYTNPRKRNPQASLNGFGHSLFQEAVGEGRIHWASTETDTVYAGHIEGAIRAGIHAANDVEQRLRHPGHEGK